MLVMLSDCCFGGWVLPAKSELMLMMLDGGHAGAAFEFLKQSAS